MTAPAADLASLQDATDRFLASLDRPGVLGDAALAEPSRLPGWTRGHVLAHLARNADALVNVLQGRPMYPGDEARNADIERDAARPLEVHLADLRDSADRLTAALADADWDATVTLRNGITDRAARIPFRRWVEIELHHIDLDTGRTVADLPGAFLDPALDYLAARLAGHTGLAPLQLRAEDGRHWAAGRPDGDPQVVTGTPAALVGWLSGRTPGSGLATHGSLPALPPL